MFIRQLWHFPQHFDASFQLLHFVTKFNKAKLVVFAFSDYNSNNLRSPDFQDFHFQDVWVSVKTSKSSLLISSIHQSSSASSSFLSSSASFFSSSSSSYWICSHRTGQIVLTVKKKCWTKQRKGPKRVAVSQVSWPFLFLTPKHLMYFHFYNGATYFHNCRPSRAKKGNFPPGVEKN